MNRFKLYLNDTNTENQKKCVKILFKHFNGTYRNTEIHIMAIWK